MQGGFVVTFSRLGADFPRPAGIPADFKHRANCRICRDLQRIFASYKRGCWLAQKTIAERLGAGVRTIRRHLRALEVAGRIITKRRGLTLTNVYRLGDFVRGRRSRESGRSDAAKVADKHKPPTGVHAEKSNTTAPPAPARGAYSQNKATEPSSAPIAPADPALVSELVANGVTPGRAARFVATIDRGKIRQQLAWLPYRNAQDSGATLATAIAHDYGEPKGARLMRLQTKAAEATLERESLELARKRAERAHEAALPTRSALERRGSLPAFMRRNLEIAERRTVASA
jgi:Helix-turn-helix domain